MLSARHVRVFYTGSRALLTASTVACVQTSTHALHFVAYTGSLRRICLGCERGSAALISFQQRVNLLQPRSPLSLSQLHAPSVPMIGYRPPQHRKRHSMNYDQRRPLQIVEAQGHVQGILNKRLPSHLQSLSRLIHGDDVHSTFA